MSQLNVQTTVGQWVARRPQTSRVFEELQIDYCCGGDRSLGQACWERRIDPASVLVQLEQTGELAVGDDDWGRNWNSAPLTDLCDHIEQTHHVYLRAELPRLTSLSAKVLAAHGQAHPELAEVQRTFAALRAELEPHMFKEERILFPAIRQLEQSNSPPQFPFGSVANPIRVMEHEHDNAGAALARIRRLTSDYRVPGDACNTYRVLLDGLAHLEADMHQHVHKENNILFPRAAQRERKACRSVCLVSGV
jgi:regulator of cell morphogenesis and NO signaling